MLPLRSSCQGVITNIFMVGSLKLHPFDLIQYMSGYALLQMGLVLAANGTLSNVYIHLRDNAPPSTYAAMIVNGSTAFFLNIVSFLANKKTSPLAMNIGGITKQVLAIILGIVIFATPMTVYTSAGVGITIVGIVWYTSANFREKQAQRAKQQVADDMDKHTAAQQQQQQLPLYHKPDATATNHTKQHASQN
ncbi:hypothetical protein PTSG_08269 [Salpingoeca rosetta]|uniref:Sugar phosphate transporter domain-containing protein n=1 Tax=Salpingoeca rosetta (strain ATCC 50818 / BSB-021) TaxID=946362 RepID=F2UIH5_SALR5|nr:uncharacterized protein PTSG_08269 [Salpingoeca rosetta]EGD76924.1 hypothetical protein PTSG_08269 [Salpingoeca rosetta]|eukprot:XP_004991295.1 hypothetical protein PTSG_08269 [Salpingoeca rosetta]